MSIFDSVGSVIGGVASMFGGGPQAAPAPPALQVGSDPAAQLSAQGYTPPGMGSEIQPSPFESYAYGRGQSSAQQAPQPALPQALPAGWAQPQPASPWAQQAPNYSATPFRPSAAPSPYAQAGSGTPWGTAFNHG